jgi:hypothetical protein
MNTKTTQSVDPVTTTGATHKNLDSDNPSKTRLPDLVEIAIEAHGGLSRWAPGAHYCFDHQNFDGLLVPTLRRVVSRVGSKPQPSGPTLVLVQISDVVIA